MHRKNIGWIGLGLAFCMIKADAQKNHSLLLECKENGGRTPKGAYFVKFSIRRDGSAQFENNDGKKTAKLSKADKSLLIKEIDRADYKAITATKSNKISPAAYDGTETTYIFYSKGHRHEIAPYKYIISPNTTLFKTIESVRQRYKL